MSETTESTSLWKNPWLWLLIICVGLGVGLALYFGLKKKPDDEPTLSTPTVFGSVPTPTVFGPSPTPFFSPTPSPTPQRSSAPTPIPGLQAFYPDTSTVIRKPAEMSGVDPLCSTKKCVFCVPVSAFKQVTNNDKDEYVDDYTTIPFYMVPKNNQTGAVMGTCPPNTIMVNNKPGQCIDCKSQYTDMICQHNKVNYAETVDSCQKGFRGAHIGKVYRGTVPR